MIPPRKTHCRRPCGAGRNSGFTLAELSISVVASSVLMAGIASSLFIASKAASTNNASNAAMMTSLAAAEMTSELATAKSFSERTTTAVTFKVADRDSNFTDETIRYTWSGQEGSPLLRYYNGTSATAADNVYSFILGYTTKSAPVKKKILFVRGNVNATRTGYDRTRRDLIASFGYQVLPFMITAETSQSDINAYLAVVDAVYISATAGVADVGTKFNAASVGILIEDGQLFDEFKLYATNAESFVDDEIKVDVNTHSITSEFENGKIKILSSNLTLNYFNNSNALASGATLLCRQPSGSKYVFVVYEKGSTLRDSSPAAGRRIPLPWGTIDFDPTKIDDNEGKTLLRRALAWATYDEVVSSMDVTLQVGSINQAKLKTQVELISKPAL